ncbi:hypothetical protein EDD15DRAFT_2193032 [Pisolithus albus]|nr:hypothetical protein EDD15DRAFT_2193032 [Pisolithus albus]
MRRAANDQVAFMASVLRVNTLVSSVLNLSLEVESCTAADVAKQYGDVELPFNSVPNVHAVLFMHLQAQCGSDVAAALRSPPDARLKSLHKLSMVTLSNSIQLLVPDGHPSIIGHSRHRTCTDTLCDIYLSYFPTSVSTSEPDSYYVLNILEHEYGSNIIDTLLRAPRAPICKADELKIARWKNKIGSTAAARQVSTRHDNDWPSITPQNIQTSQARCSPGDGGIVQKTGWNRNKDHANPLASEETSKNQQLYFFQSSLLDEATRGIKLVLCQCSAVRPAVGPVACITSCELVLAHVASNMKAHYVPGNARPLHVLFGAIASKTTSVVSPPLPTHRNAGGGPRRNIIKY